jgi:Trk K+ transport system NAD-binding subunit
MAIATCFLGPVLYNMTRPLEKYPPGTTIIVGGSSKGVLLARRLSIHGKTSVIIESNEKRYKDISSKGLKAYYSDGLDPATYRNLGLTNASYVVVDSGNEKINVRICELLRKDLNHEKIISMAHGVNIEQQLTRLDVETIDVRRLMATTIETLIIRPATYHALIESFENFTIEEIPITNPDLDGHKVKEIAFHKDAILIMAKTDDNLFIPHGETLLRTGNVLYILGTDTALENARARLK